MKTGTIKPQMPIKQPDRQTDGNDRSQPHVRVGETQRVFSLSHTQTKTTDTATDNYQAA